MSPVSGGSHAAQLAEHAATRNLAPLFTDYRSMSRKSIDELLSGSSLIITCIDYAWSPAVHAEIARLNGAQGYVNDVVTGLGHQLTMLI